MSLILTQRFDVKFDMDSWKQPFFRFLKVLPAYNNTFVASVIKSHRQQGIIHFDDKGKLLHECLYKEQTMEQFGMLNDRQVIMIDCTGNKIITLDLQTYQKKQTQFIFKRQDYAVDANLWTFSESKYICISECGNIEEKSHIRLSYFHYPINPGDKPFHTYYSQETWIQKQYQLKKTNNHSQFVWFKREQNQQITFYIYDLREKQGMQLRNFKVANKVGQPHGLAKVLLGINYVFQMRPYVLMLSCHSDRKFDEGKFVNTHFIVDLKTDQIRQSYLKFGKDGEFQRYVYDVNSIGNASIWKSFSCPDNQKIVESPVFYVDNINQTIIPHDEMQEYHYKDKYEFPGYDGNMMVESRFDVGQPKDVSVICRKVVNQKEVLMYFMHQLNPDFDEDLLQTALELVDLSK